MQRTPPSLVHEQPIEDVDELDDLADESGLLGQLAQDRDGRRFAEVEAAAGQRPDAARGDRLGDPAEQDPIDLVAAQRVGRDPRPRTPSSAHGASSRAR